MSVKFYLDLFPVATTSIENAITRHVKVVANHYLDADPNRTSPHSKFLSQYPEIVCYEYASRLDGIFIFSIQTRIDIPDNISRDIASHLSDLLKNRFGHRHEFHEYPYKYYPVYGIGTKTATVISNIVLFLYRNLASYNIAEEIFHVEPILLDISGQSLSVTDLASPDKAELIKINAIPYDSKRERHKDFSQKACLKLLTIYARKREKIFDVYHARRESKQIIKSAILPVITLAISYYVFDIEA